MYPVYNISADAANSTEQLGTKRKFWFRHPDLGDCLFKEGRGPDTGDDWSEKVASELCTLLNLPHATYHLALWKERRGVITPKFVPDGGSLIHGNELMTRLVRGYPERKLYHVQQHTLKIVLAIMRINQIQLPLTWERFLGVESPLDVFVGYLMFDAWIANQDRHHENWALVVTQGRTVHLAPSYDHASSLGANETDENREDRLRTRDKRRSVEEYVKRATSAFFPAESPDCKAMPTMEAFRVAGTVRPNAARAWLAQLEQISADNIAQIFSEVPQERISAVAVEFGRKMLEVNRDRLLDLGGEWK